MGMPFYGSRIILKTNNSSSTKLLVWDAEGLPPTGAWITILWSSFKEGTDPKIISLPQLVEEQADELKTRYLAWIFEFSEKDINGKRLVDHLELWPGLSYWWMTSLAQKFNSSGTSQINNAIKALLVENLVIEYGPKSIELVSCNKMVAVVLQDFCQALKIQFKWESTGPVREIKSKSIAKNIFHSLAYPLQAHVQFLWFVFRSFPVLFKRRNIEPAITDGITFIDVLVHLDRDTFKTGRFISNYWTALVDKLIQSGTKINWLHNYYCHEPISSLSRAHDLIEAFNKNGSKNQSHILLEMNLSMVVFIKALKYYYRSWKASRQLTVIDNHFTPAGSSVCFWPLFRHEWIDSLKGRDAMVNCLRISLYEKTFREIPYQKTGIYIQENQPWEMALIYAWRAGRHGKIIGVPHTAVRYWDLRYFYDSRSYRKDMTNNLPMPDLVAVNGAVAQKSYLDWGYPEQQLKTVEALRFLHLLNRTSTNAITKSPASTLRVLICGDFLPTTNYKILSWLQTANQYLSEDCSYILKPHPSCAIKLDDFPSLSLEITNANLEELMTDSDVVFTSNNTAAVVDAYYSGIPVIQMLDSENLNMSPLRNVSGVLYVKNPVELVTAIRNSQQPGSMEPSPYFYLDRNLPRWQKLLNLELPDTKKLQIKEIALNS